MLGADMARITSAFILSTIVVAAQPAPDATRVLADMRQALGGDAALAGIQAFSATGTETRTVGGRSFSKDVEVLCALPDRFVRVRRSSGPFNDLITEADGFSGDALIHRRDANIPYPPDPGANDTPAQHAERERQKLLSARHDFARLIVALLGQSAADPARVSAGAVETVDRTSVNALTLQSQDGYTARLLIDASTHLPFMMQWKAARGVVVSSSSTVVVRNGQAVSATPPAPFPPMPDPASMPLVEHRLYYSDFRSADGVNWPHRFKEVVDGRVEVETRIGKFKMNPKINPKEFDPSGNS